MEWLKQLNNEKTTVTTITKDSGAWVYETGPWPQCAYACEGDFNMEVCLISNRFAAEYKIPVSEEWATSSSQLRVEPNP